MLWRLKLGLSIGIVSTCVYAVVVQLSEAAGYTLDMAWGYPGISHRYWLVAPGAALLGLLVYEAVRQLPARRMVLGAALGLALAPFNACLAVLVYLLEWELQARLGFTEPWRYGFACLFAEWQRLLPLLIQLSLPVAAPCGALMGGLLGWVSSRVRPGGETSASPGSEQNRYRS
ncbi:MAG: hypothetical protein HY319_24535 [Armatimonadetes bacterium]|nr:hypothetical protein [Armatimonadota bacterium]